MKRLVATILLLGCATLAHAKRECPIVLLSGQSDHSGINVTVRNNGKFAIYRMEFNCVVRGATRNQSPMRCTENSPMFFPGSEYTASFYYTGTPRPVVVSVKALSQSNGLVWKPLRKDSCQTLLIAPPRKRAK